MFYNWFMKQPPQTRCYIAAFVPDAETLKAGNKSYVGSGDLDNIQIWHVATPPNPNALSWNSRPERLALLGTTSFAQEEQVAVLRDGKELRPPTALVDCGGLEEVQITVEVVCESCYLELEQVFSMPGLGFDLVDVK
ncbi:hypothetical protein FIBSPDRAFT_870188 [Athelia psychrophila]|uniref:Uncharacterized protein n=1 Tax=Athelia psychrophila TaxID=1759441 RepID=A0A166B9B7_9AGAM|nr:hypothetical protein FIBSPDRAFT_870188 [Fibularhizoctonia sp. CBS 109695]